MKTEKRIRPRPNAVLVEMDDDVRGKLDSMVEGYEAMTGERYPAARLIRNLIRAEYAAMQARAKRNRKKSGAVS